MQGIEHLLRVRHGAGIGELMVSLSIQGFLSSGSFHFGRWEPLIKRSSEYLCHSEEKVSAKKKI